MLLPEICHFRDKFPSPHMADCTMLSSLIKTESAALEKRNSISGFLSILYLFYAKNVPLFLNAERN
jgi:hypothetical protein